MSPTPNTDIAIRSLQGAFWDDGFVLPSDPPDGAAGGKGRVFFALCPPLPIAQSLNGFARRVEAGRGLRSKLVKTECLHVSLIAGGNYDELPGEMIAAFADAASTVEMPAFHIAFDRLMSFKGKPSRPLVLVGDDGVSGIRMLREKLMLALHRGGFVSRGQREFTPHLTLAYDERDLGTRSVEPIGWIARDFVLIHSRYGQGRHDVLGRWPLRSSD
jgi:RNA 2',3'-cyclic 3'-phosphodiesterase